MWGLFLGIILNNLYKIKKIQNLEIKLNESMNNVIIDS